MYRKYQGSTGQQGNSFLKQKWDIIEQEYHLHRLRTITSRTHHSPPRVFMHMLINPKKMQAEQDRISEIQRENESMTQRIAKVHRGTGYVDHKNEYQTKSLNGWKRQNEMVLLAFQNKAFQRRIMDVKSVVNHNKLEDEYLIQLKYKANIAKFPQNWKEVRKEEAQIRQTIRKEFLEKEQKMNVKKEKGKKDLKKHRRSAKKQTTKSSKATTSSDA